MDRKPETTARRIGAGLVGYAALLLLLADLGQATLDVVWAVLTAPLGLAARIGSQLLAATDPMTGGPLFALTFGLAGAGLVALAALLIWPATARSSATTEPESRSNLGASDAAAVVALPVAEGLRTNAAAQRRVA